MVDTNWDWKIGLEFQIEQFNLPQHCSDLRLPDRHSKRMDIAIVSVFALRRSDVDCRAGI